MQKVGQRDEKDIVESVAAHQCLTFMIKECKKLFKVPFDMMNGLGQHDDCLINEFGLNPQAHPQELRYDIITILSFKNLEKHQILLLLYFNFHLEMLEKF